MNYAELLTAIEDFDLESYLLDKGFDCISSRSKEWMGPCPSCGKKKLSVDVIKKAWKCWTEQEYEDFWDERSFTHKRRPTRGAGGVIALIKWMDNLDTKEAIQFIAEHSIHGIGIEELPDLRVMEDLFSTGSSPAISPPEFWRHIEQPLQYMYKRSITMDDVHLFGLFYCDIGRYANRIVFPVWENKKLIYWQARAMYEQENSTHKKFIKALNPDRTPGTAVSSEVLMNLDIACQYPRVAIVEGPMDCVRTGPDAVCTFGKQITPAQVTRLLKNGVKAIDLMWDAPKEGDKTPYGAWPDMLKVSPWLSTFFDVKLVFLPHGDPADWSRMELTQFRNATVSNSKISNLSVL